MEPTGPYARPAAGALIAWLVHLFTASGAVLGLFALIAIERGDWHLALVWLLVALVVDGVDGSLARATRVKERLPRIDGNALDLVIDYLNYVFVPALFIWHAELVPAALAPALAAAILVSSLYIFARSDMKTEDGYFRGFPALWNLVAFYLFVTRPGPEAGAIAVVMLVMLTFAPIHFVHPFRVRDYGRWLPALAVLWAIATAVLLWPGWNGPGRTFWLAASLSTGALMLAPGLLRSLRGPLSPRAVPPVSAMAGEARRGNGGRGKD